MKKPVKKSDGELFELISEHIEYGNYIFLKHAKQRLEERAILDIEVLDILEGKPGRKTKRNKSKDKHEEGRHDWNYCIEGASLDGEKIRVIVSFDEDLMPIITVVRLD